MAADWGTRIVPSQRPKLRKREIVFAVAMGALAAGGAALTLSAFEDDGSPTPFVMGPDQLTYKVAPFDEIATEGPQDVVVTYGDAQSVRAEGSPEAIALLEVVVENGQLNIRPRSRSWMWAWPQLNATTYYVTVPRLESVRLEGSGDIRVDKVEGKTFAGTIEGSGDLTLGSLKVDSAVFTVNGPGDISAAGTARETRVMIEGPGNIRANGLRTRTASVTVNGPGDAELTVDELVSVAVNGPGDVDIAGPARCTISQSGPGDVDCESAD